jgi:hypothetical protein
MGQKTDARASRSEADSRSGPRTPAEPPRASRRLRRISIGRDGPRMHRPGPRCPMAGEPAARAGRGDRASASPEAGVVADRVIAATAPDRPSGRFLKPLFASVADPVPMRLRPRRPNLLGVRE